MGHTFDLELAALWRILLIGIVLGAGLPALFAVGVRALAYGQGGEAELHAVGASPPAHPIGKFLAGVCFAIVLAAVALGIVYIVASGFGKVLSFEHIYPVIMDKKK